MQIGGRRPLGGRFVRPRAARTGAARQHRPALTTSPPRSNAQGRGRRGAARAASKRSDAAVARLRETACDDHGDAPGRVARIAAEAARRAYSMAMAVLTSIRGLPRARRFALSGAVAAGSVGALAGLIIGVGVHPATAWFAVVELGVPAALTGGLVGLIAGAAANLLTRVRRRPMS